MNKRLIKIILACQDARKKYGDDYDVKCKKQIDKFSAEIKTDKLIDTCSNDEQWFAKQLCIVNNLKYE